jgi:hypothetical protein
MFELAIELLFLERIFTDHIICIFRTILPIEPEKQLEIYFVRTDIIKVMPFVANVRR